MNTKLLEGKTAIITGGSSGVGLSMGHLFAEEGANVVLTALREGPLQEAVEEIKAKGGKAIGVSANVTDPEAVKKTFEEAVKAFGHVDIVVNNAGHGSGSLSIEGTDDEMYDIILNTNLKGPFMMMREALKYFFAQGSGNIINVSSVNGIRPVTGAAYGASKSGLVGLTKNVAMRTVGTGIRVNCLCPGLTLTPMAMANTMTNSEVSANNLQGEGGQVVNGKASFDSVKPADMFPGDGKMTGYLHARTNRFCACVPEDEAKAALFLASDLSSGVHGQTLVVDRGGYL